MTERLPLRIVSDADLKACETQGECCGCGACCELFIIDNMPVAGREGPGSVVSVEGVLLRKQKIVGQRCWHLMVDAQGLYRCALHGSPHQPRACNEWRGHTHPENMGAEPMPEDRPSNFAWMRTNAKRILLDPTRERIEMLHRVAANGALELLLKDVVFFENRRDVENFFDTWMMEMGIMDHELFRIMRVPEALRMVKKSFLQNLQMLCETMAKEPYTTFLHDYIRPALEERTKSPAE